MKKTSIILFLIFFLNSLQSFAQSSLPQNVQNDINSFLKEAEQYVSASNFSEAYRCYNSAAYLYWTNYKLREAADNYLKALIYIDKLGNTKAAEMVCSNLGLIFADLEEYQKSIQYFSRSIDIKRKQNKKVELASELQNIANVYINIKKYEDANKNLLEALDIAKEQNDITTMRRIYGSLASNYEALGKTDKSIEYFNLFSSLDNYIKQQQIKEIKEKAEVEVKKMEGITKKVIDEKNATEETLKNTENSLKQVQALTKEQQLQIDLLTKEKQLNEMILKEKEARLRNIALTRNFIILFVIFLLIVVIIILRNYNTIKKQKIEIEIKNKSIQDGINYAQRIQKALFAAQEEFLSLFPDSFILFMPRDVVSGDFLWFSSANLKSVLSRDGFNEIKDNKDNNKYIISAVDCTGHGVPGAMMSMIGYKLIYEIISSGIVSPEKILFYLHKGLINQFRQDDKSEIQDGMDLALCTIDLSSKIIEYSGAKNPLIYIKDGKLNKIKGDNFSTGGKMSVDDERIFTKHTIKVDSPTYIYMFSDGYIDQLGGVNGRKFLLKNLETLLFKIYNKPFSEQYKLLVDALKNWQGEHKQVDDILIVGFKIS